MTDGVHMPLRKRLLLFVGRRVLLLLVSGVFIGISLFAIELAFAYSLQAFLLCLHIAMPSSAGLPLWAREWQVSKVLAFIFCVGLLRGLLNWAAVYTQGAAAEEFRHLQRSRVLRWAFHGESVSTWEAMTLFDPAVGGGATAVSAIQGLAVQVSCTLMILGALMWISPVLSIAVLVSLGAVFLPMRSVDRKIIESATGQTTSLALTSQKLIVSVRNLLLIQIYGTQGLEERQAQSTLADYRRHVLRLYKITGLKYAMPQFVGMFLICVITLAAGRQGQLAPALLVTYFYLVIRLLGSLSGMNITFASVAGAWPEAKKLYAWWESRAHDRPNAPKRRPELMLAARSKDAQPVGWSLREISYKYPDGTKPVLQNLSLHLDPGQVLAITGPSGSGKSTLLNIMLGSLLPASGSIEAVLPGGLCRPLESYRDELLPLVGYVGPESFMLEGTIRQNLLYGLQHSPTQDELDTALAKAECAFVDELAGGLGYTLTEQGQGLSAGQKQRLALARALLRQPKIIILDEATSNLDSDTEERLVDTLARLKGEMTIVAATHRKALLRIADKRINLQ